MSDKAFALSTELDVARAPDDVFALQKELARGVRPRDWPADWVRHLPGEADGTTVQGWADLFGFFHAEDCGRYDEAGQLIE